MNFYLTKNGQQLGPYPVEQIRSFLQQGTVTTADQVWAEGWPTWMAIASVPGLQSQSPGQPQNTLASELIPKWFWVTCTVLLGLFELMSLIRIAAMMEHSRLQGEANYIYSDTYQTEKSWENFFHSLTGDNSVATEEEQKQESLESENANNNAVLVACFIVQWVVRFGLAGSILFLMVKNGFFPSWKSMSQSDLDSLNDPLLMFLMVAFLGTGLLGCVFWLLSFQVGMELVAMFGLPIIVTCAMRFYWLVTSRFAT